MKRGLGLSRMEEIIQSGSFKADSGGFLGNQVADWFCAFVYSINSSGLFLPAKFYCIF